MAAVVWRAFGRDVPNFIDAFFGSNAILLARPGGAGKIETINDADRMVANFTRSIIHAPFDTAAWCDGPVNEADLHAVHRWLVEQLQPDAEFAKRMHSDPDYFDAKIAGRWVWGLCCWIGGGWCVEPQNSKHPKLDGIGKGVHSQAGHSSEHQKRPHMAGMGKGIHQRSGSSEWAQRPHMTGNTAGHGVHSLGLHAKLPNLALGGENATAAGRGVLSESSVQAYSPGRRPRMSDAGNGVHLPSLGNDKGIHGVSAPPGTFLHALQTFTVPDAPPAFDWFLRLSMRLRRVRVACGDFERVLGDSVLGKGKNVGGRRPCAVFLDPPYGHDRRCPYLYGEESANVAQRAADWAREHGNDPDLRIALCGYDGEHSMPANWTVHHWKAARGYANADNENRSKETIWFSPHCLPIDQQRSLFGGAL